MKTNNNVHGYNIYDMWLDSEGWIVDGERGFVRYPGSWTDSMVREYYQSGWDAE